MTEMPIMLEEFDGEPTFTAMNEAVYDEIHARAITVESFSSVKANDDSITRSAMELIRLRGAAAFKFAAEQAEEAYDAGEIEAQRVWRRIGWAVLEMRRSLRRGFSFNVVS